DQQKRVPSSKLPGTITLGLAWIVSDALAADPEEPETPPMPEGDETPEAKPSPAGVPVNPAAPRPARPVTRGRPGERNIPVGKSTEDVQQLVNRVDELVDQMTGLTNNLKKAINPEELRTTMRQLNTTLANASRTFSPEGGLNQTAQRTLAKLEDAIEQMRDMITRVNKGEGSVGMLLNDPAYAQELKAAAENINRLLGRVGSVRFVVDIGAEQMRGYDDGRGWFRLGIWPSHDRYYLLGITVDPRGRLTHTLTTTTVAGQSTTTETLVTEKTGFLFTAMVGKVFWNRLDLSVGALHGDGTLSASIWFGPNGREDLLQLRNDVYSRGPAGSGIDDRVTVTVKIWKAAYLKGGFEGFRKVGGALPWIYGAGVSFDDEDIKLLFALR
ncbi:MAG TPA: hypothetical protein VM598_04055, partial [Bdellovibrionota bacterium]|nr:hypothetical protein [Bdellovibrionota bacterium]